MANPGEVSLWLSIAKDVVTTAAAITAASVALLGLKTWRRQLRGHTEYDLARRYLRAVLRVRDGIRLVRNPFMSGGEISGALKGAGIESDQRQVQQATYSRTVYATRWNRLSEARSDLRVEALEAEVLWGPKAQEILVPLDRAIGELYAALHRYLDDLERPTPYDPSRPLDEDRGEKVRAVIYEMSTDPVDDKFTGKINAAIKELNSLLRLSSRSKDK